MVVESTVIHRFLDCMFRKMTGADEQFHCAEPNRFQPLMNSKYKTVKYTLDSEGKAATFIKVRTEKQCWDNRKGTLHTMQMQ